MRPVCAYPGPGGAATIHAAPAAAGPLARVASGSRSAASAAAAVRWCARAGPPLLAPGWERAPRLWTRQRRRRRGPPLGALAAATAAAAARGPLLRGRRRSGEGPAVGRRASEGETGPLGVAERYSSEDWRQHWIDFPHSRILYRISAHLSFNIALAVAVAAVQHFTSAVTAVPATPLILCSTALGLLLVFRTTAAYERWQQGQKDAYMLRHHLQQLQRALRPWLSEVRFVRLRDQVCAFPRIAAVHLTAKPGAGFLYGIGPRDLMTQISDELAVLFSGPGVPMAGLYAHERAQDHINEVLRCIGNMERLASEAVPRDYSRHTSRFLTLWMCTLPFVLLECGGLMPLVVATISWALLSIEEIGHALEDPFNSPTQMVPVQAILEYGGGEHALTPDGKAGKASEWAEPPMPWERRVAWDAP